MCRAVGFLSSRGGIGKSSIIFALSKFIAESGKRVLIFDSYFGLNQISLKFANRKELDFKEYLLGNNSQTDVLNMAERGIFYVKTNKADFDYAKHKNLIKRFMNDMQSRFDFIFIDINNFDFKVMNLMLEVVSECMLVMGDTKTDVVCAYKLVYKLNNYKNITNIKLVVNKAKIISQIKGECLDAREIEKVLHKEILFVIPWIVKWNYFNYKNITKKQSKIMKIFCNSFITNSCNVLDYEKEYRGIIGYFKRKVGEKYE